MNTLQIGRRSFKVESMEGRDGRPRYMLRGARGAVYTTMRNEKHPHMMFLINERGFGIVEKGIWLSDQDGTLKIAAGWL